MTKSKLKLKQVVLEREVEGGKQTQTVWLDKIDKLKVGRRLTLQGEPDVWWTILQVSENVKTPDQLYSRHGKLKLGSIIGDLEK